MKKSMTALSVGSVALLLLAGCGTSGGSVSSNNTNGSSTQGSTSKSSSTPVKGGTLTVAIDGDPDTLDAQKTGDANADTVLGQIGASLVFQNPKTLKFEPELAKSWDISTDGLTYTFHLRTGVTFQDGTPLTAADFVSTFQRAINPATASVATGGQLANVKSMTAPDKQTLVITLSKPFSWFLAALSDPGYMQPISPTALKSEGTSYGRHPVSAGPWKFDNWKSGQSITLDSNSAYKWAPTYFTNQGAPYPSQFVYKVIPQEETRIAALQTGEVDVADVAPKDLPQFQNNSKYNVYSYLMPGLGLFVMFNLEKPSLQDLKVRQAINYAINRKSIIQAVLMGQGQVAYSPLPPSLPDYDPKASSYGYNYNKDKAQQLLKDAGYTMGSDGYLQKDGKTLSLGLNSIQNGEWDQAAQLIQAQLKDIGVKVAIHDMDHASLIAAGAKGQFDMTLMHYTYTDPDVLYFFYDSKGALNFGHAGGAALDGLLDKSRQSTDPAVEQQTYAAIQKDIVQNAYLAPIYLQKQFYVASSRVHGLQVSPLYGPLFQDAWVSN